MKAQAETYESGARHEARADQVHLGRVPREVTREQHLKLKLGLRRQARNTTHTKKEEQRLCERPNTEPL
jgi:hypothetical protein